MSEFDEKLLLRLKKAEQEIERLQKWQQPAAAWIHYTPTWTATTTNPALGNGTLTGRYTVLGKTCVGDIYLLMGSTTAYGSGAWALGLPFTAANAGIRYGGQWAALDTGTANYTGSLFISAGASVINFFVRDQGANYFSSAIPHTWAGTDYLFLSFIYEIT